jgi:hypothetical protein
VRRAFLPALALLLALPALRAARAQISRTVDRTQYSIHVEIADQIDLPALRRYLAEAERLLQSDEGANDVACCLSLQAAPPSVPPNRPDSDSLVVFGTPGDGLDVIETEAEFWALEGRKAIVAAISWCGNENPSLVGCAETPGDTLVVGLDAGLESLSQAIAHERGHNANLSHRNESCALMSPSLSFGGGCLTQAECTQYRWIPGGTTLGSCDCMGPVVGNPVDADGTACTKDGAPGTCHHAGLCDPAPANDACSSATPLAGTVALLDENYNARGDGGSSCSAGGDDLWYRYTPPCGGQIQLDLCDADPDLSVSVHRSCAAGSQNELVCSASCGASRPACAAGGTCASAPAQAGIPVWLRVSSTSGEGPFVLRASCQPGVLLDADADGVSDVLDNCRNWPNAGQADTDANGIGDACECGDQNGDGRVDTSDLIAINVATFTPGLATPLCDANADGLCDVRDILAANAKIYGAPAYCSRYPPP